MSNETKTDTAPVDVLAVMDFHEGLFRKQVGTPLNELAEARAAVAELMEACKEVSIYTRGGHAASAKRWRAALARCGGAK